MYHYVIIRTGLPLGVMGAQIAHAAGESSPGQLGRGTYVVVLQADTEQLLSLERTLQRQGVEHKAIREVDAPYSGALLAIGLAPKLRSEVRKYVSSFPLLR